MVNQYGYGVTAMKYAENIKDISNAFKQGPLDEKDMDEFYYPSTMEFRTGDKYSSLIRVIYEACQLPSERNVLEYNGSRWHDVHPLVAEFLVDQELV